MRRGVFGQCVYYVHVHKKGETLDFAEHVTCYGEFLKVVLVDTSDVGCGCVILRLKSQCQERPNVVGHQLVILFVDLLWTPTSFAKDPVKAFSRVIQHN